MITNNKDLTVWKLTALWGFSEAALGGILHAFKLPFTGIMLGGIAVILITLISHYSEDKRQILRSTLIVLIIKAFVAPHTPVLAYLLVFIQGLSGFLFFKYIDKHRLAAFSFTVFILMFFAFQKIIFLTLVFGNTLWNAIDQFYYYAIKQFDFLEYNISLSYLLVFLYISIYLISSLIIGFYAGKIPDWISEYKLPENYKVDPQEQVHYYRMHKKSKSKFRLFFFLFILGIIIIVAPEDVSSSLLLMLIRAVFILLLWFIVIGPFILKMIKKYLSNKKEALSLDIDSIIAEFPKFKSYLFHSKELSKDFRGLKRIKIFIASYFSLVLNY